MRAPARRLVGFRRGMDRWPERMVFSKVCIPVGVSLLLGEEAVLDDSQNGSARRTATGQGGMTLLGDASEALS